MDPLPWPAHPNSYDLLVAADGCWSRVRRAAAAQAPELSVTTTPANRQYKVIRCLPPVPHMSLLPAPGAPPGSSQAFGRLLMVKEAPAALVAAGGGAPGTIFFSQPTPEAVTAVVTWPHKRWAAAGVTAEHAGDEEAYRRLLAASYPALPEEWALEVRRARNASGPAGLRLCIAAAVIRPPSVCCPRLFQMARITSQLALLATPPHPTSPHTAPGR